MTCKDCIHYDVCHNNFKNIDLNEEMTDEHCCVYFKDKSRFVELLCGVGDTLYLVDFEYGIFKCIVNDIQISRNNEPIYRLYYYSQSGDESTKFEWDVNIANHCFGKMIFFTKEEAEAKLKELNENEQFRLTYNNR